MSLGLRRIDTGTRVTPPLGGLVLKASLLAAADSADALMDAARREAAAMIDAARQAAQRVAEDELREREADLLRREAALERAMWQRSAGFAEAVAQEWAQALQALETRAQAIVAQALARLTLEMPTPARLSACVQALARQAGRPDTGVLWVSPDDLPLVPTVDALPWPVQASADVAPGAVRLVAAQGRWECDVSGALERMLGALSTGHAPIDRPLLDALFTEENTDA
jgi:hypothetical protein